ncbi:MAG: hypothetical protein HZY79_08150 [Rhodoblastus sp.]|nr:MAG: hypothetical protein HZY79_08150 [Rhodoblastus sp.]
MTLLPKGRLDFIFLDAQTDVGQVIVPNPECHYAKIYSDGKNAMIIIYSFGEILPDFAFQSILTNKILIQIRMDRKDKLVIMDSKTTSEGALDGEIALIDFSGKNFFAYQNCLIKIFME